MMDCASATSDANQEATGSVRLGCAAREWHGRGRQRTTAADGTHRSGGRTGDESHHLGFRRPWQQAPALLWRGQSRDGPHPGPADGEVRRALGLPVILVSGGPGATNLNARLRGAVTRAEKTPQHQNAGTSSPSRRRSGESPNSSPTTCSSLTLTPGAILMVAWRSFLRQGQRAASKW